MVSFWPWRRDDSSTASFEKTLSTLSTKITDSQARLERVRASSRRVKVLSTLYLSFAYLVYAIVLLLVVGYRNLGAYEWAGLAGGPVLIYVTRTLLTTVYNFRIESLSNRLKEQQEERAKTIQKLKDATKYDSTMELIEKYGGTTSENKAAAAAAAGGKGKKGSGKDEEAGNEAGGDRRKSGGTPRRTNMPPPATANIQRSAPGTPSAHPSDKNMEPSAEFAPNADYVPSPFPPPPGVAPNGGQTVAAPPPGPVESHWYDRIFDVLLGEDETAPKNRIVLICGACRLVNGQAPPGTRSLAELGRWRCMACGAMNGEDKVPDEGERIVREVLAEKKEHAGSSKAKAATEEVLDAATDPEEADESGGSEAEIVEPVDVPEWTGDDGPASAVKRRRGKGKK